ncbi:MAG: hypothetical protein LBI66_11585 [Burkholderiaceae bacterium]|jgi:hypothetical protein|nr:hypothetical protein [Burkholderiaceae bacterium]
MNMMARISRRLRAVRAPRAAVRGAAFLALGALVACSPKLDWRDLTVEGASLRVQLPCDPQLATKPVELGQGLGVVQMSMVGCDADYATYAVSHFLVSEPSRAAEMLSYWQAAVLGQMNPGAPGQAPAGARQLHAKGDGAFLPKGALNLPQSLRTTFEGIGPQGWKLTAHGVWFARMEPQGARLYHAVIYSDKPRAEEANHFFGSLQLQ